MLTTTKTWQCLVDVGIPARLHYLDEGRVKPMIMIFDKRNDEDDDIEKGDGDVEDDDGEDGDVEDDQDLAMCG